MANGQPPIDEFELMRRRLRQRGAATAEGRQRELDRRFAAAGNLPSGAAFRIRQQAAEGAQRATGEALQDVNILQAQTQRAEREAAAQRGLQRFGIEQQAQTARRGQDIGLQTAQLGSETARRAQDIGLQTAQLGSETARRGQDLGLQTAGLEAETARRGQDVGLQAAQLSADTQRDLAEMQIGSAVELANLSGEQARQIEEMRGRFGAEAQERSIKAARKQLRAQIDAQENLMELDIGSKMALAQMDHDSRMSQLAVSDRTARFLGEIELNNQITIAEWDRNLRQQGTDIQDKLADAGVAENQFEAKLNTMATFVNALEPMKNAGFNDREVRNMLESLGLDFGGQFIQTQLLRANFGADGDPGTDAQHIL
jgi:hypothetical protein